MAKPARPTIPPFWVALEAERDAARVGRDEARAVAAAARRLVADAYTPWESAGGPDECAHGIAGSLACRACDLAVVMAGTTKENTDAE